jgi:hypothetical protein
VKRRTLERVEGIGLLAFAGGRSAYTLIHYTYGPHSFGCSFLSLPTLPFSPDLSLPSPSHPNIDSVMEHPLETNTRMSMKTFDEKNWFDHSASQTPAPTATFAASWTRFANLTRFVSKKLLTWGVEARGAVVSLGFENRIDPDNRTCL